MAQFLNTFCRFIIIIIMPGLLRARSDQVLVSRFPRILHGKRSFLLRSGRYLKPAWLTHSKSRCRIELVLLAADALQYQRMWCQLYQYDSASRLAVQQSKGLQMPSRLQPRTTASRAVFVESGSHAGGPAGQDNLKSCRSVWNVPLKKN